MHYVRRAPSSKADPYDEGELEEAEPAEATPPKQAEQTAREAPAEPIQVTRLKQGLIDDIPDQPVPRQDTMKGYEYAPEQYVVFKDDELRRLRPKTSAEMQILRSVRLPEIDPIYFETSYYVVPDRAGERAYALLFAALKKTEYVALAKVAMHGREHVMVIRPASRGLLAHTMFYGDEIGAENEYPANTTGIAAKELQLATTFVEAIAGPFAPEEFKDTYREEVESLIAQKIERREVAASSGPSIKPAAAPVVDIMEALKKSIELASANAKAPEEVPRRKPAKVTEIKPKTQRRRASN